MTSESRYTSIHFAFHFSSPAFRGFVYERASTKVKADEGESGLEVRREIIFHAGQLTPAASPSPPRRGLVSLPHQDFPVKSETREGAFFPWLARLHRSWRPGRKKCRKSAGIFFCVGHCPSRSSCLDQFQSLGVKKRRVHGGVWCVFSFQEVQTKSDEG